MTVQICLFQSYYSIEWRDPTLSKSNSHFPTPAHLAAKSFLPSAGLMYIARPSARRRALNRLIDRLEDCTLPGSEYVIAHLHDKYRRNLTETTIRQSGEVLIAFLLFFQGLDRQRIEEITRKDIADYIEYEQERGLKIRSVRNHLMTVYAFLRFLVHKEILAPKILYKKIRLKLPEELPRAIPMDETRRLLSVIDKDRDLAMILLLLHTGMRIGELLNVKMTDIILPERKILLHLGEKNCQGRVIYYSEQAEHALRKWLAVRDPRSEYLFYGQQYNQLCYVAAWDIFRQYLKKAGLAHKGYSLHSLRHSFATNMLNAGLRLEVLQKLLGHLSIDVTLQYAKLSNTTREKEFFQAMAIVEKGVTHEYSRVNPHLQAVFEEKKLLRAHSKELPA